MKRTLLFTFALATISLALSSCGGGGGSVYMAGTVYGGDGQKATLWKDGTPQILSDASSQAHSVHVSDGSVYVAGVVYDFDDGIFKATLWKDSVPQTLSDKQSSATSVHVSGDDVYVAGLLIDDGDNPKAVVWKDGEILSVFTQEQGFSIEVAGIFVK